MRIETADGVVDPIHARFADQKDAIKQAKARLANTSFPHRAQLCKVLAEYNAGLGADQSTLDNIKRLASSERYCVLTGQQLGFMGGPAYTFLKLLTCLLLAKEADAIPLFWAATEDHDQDEIRNAAVLDRKGNLKYFGLSWPDHRGWMVEDLPLYEEHARIIEAFWRFVDPLSLHSALHKGSASYAEAMLRLFLRAFQGTGLVILEPKLLRPFATSFFKREIELHAQATDTLKRTYEDLQAQGMPATVPIADTRSRLFYKNRENRRTALFQKSKNCFAADEMAWSTEELLTLIEEHPERFSTNVLARPVLQSSVLPTLAYVAGPSERAYHLQVTSYFALHKVSMPWIVPRISASFILPHAKQYLDKLGLVPFASLPERWSDYLPELIPCLDKWRESWENSAEQLNIQKAASFIQSIEPRMRDHLVKKTVEELDLPRYALHLLRNLLRPKGQLQERVLNWWMFQACAEKNLIQELTRHLCWSESAHYFISLP